MKHAKAVRRIIFTVLIVAAVIVGFNYLYGRLLSCEGL